MSATLAVMITELEPDWRVRVYERLDGVAQESSNPWNNAGTGHAALCELNYTPERPDGSVDISKAVTVNEQFRASREFWNHLVAQGELPATTTFLTSVPHMTFVRGEENVAFLRRRFEALTSHPNFAGMEFSDDPHVIASWAPLLIDSRSPEESVAATRSLEGTDVDFGALTRSLLDVARSRGVEVVTSREVRSVRRRRGGGWRLRLKDLSWNPRQRRTSVDARFVFVGAGGGALRLLQSARIPEIRGYAGFPISGQFMRTRRPEIVAAHHAKVYGKADVGAPPMSVPHLDTRVVDGEPALMFGPYAGFSIRFLKHGALLDAVRTIRPSNLVAMLAVARDNLDLVKYLVGELAASPLAKARTLRAFVPTVDPAHWETITAGQRVQVIKSDPKRGGVLEFGTEVVAAEDGSIAGLLGASPGASTAAHAMASLLQRCFPERAEAWVPQLQAMMPSLAPADSRSLEDDVAALAGSLGARA